MMRFSVIVMLFLATSCAEGQRANWRMLCRNVMCPADQHCEVKQRQIQCFMAPCPPSTRVAECVPNGTPADGSA
uniref:Secreted protein n=1 Tax=Plectus sambesii TaxID=2011161 RepID=A0A914W827_9BILA